MSDGVSTEDDTQASTEFDDAFNEFAGGNESDTPIEALDPTEDERPEEEVEQPTEEVTQEAEQPTEQATGKDPWKEAPESLRGEFEKLKKDHDYWQHRYQSDVGRVSAYQRQVEELKAQLQQGQKKEEPTKQQVGEAMESPDKWNQFKEEYPDVAAYLDPIRAQVSGLKQSFDSLKGQISPLTQAEQDRTLKESYQRIAYIHPDWQDVVKHPVFDQWLTRQSPGIRHLAASDDPEDVVALVSNFKHWADSELAKQDAHAKGAGDNPASTSAGQSVEAIKQRRARQLADAQTVTNRGRVQESAIPADDFDAAFAVFAKQKERAFS
jgi:hypothetical protein